MSGKNLLIHSFKSLTPKQKLFMWVLMKNEHSLVKTCKEMKMNTDTFYRWWYRKPEFKSYYHFILSLHTDGAESFVWGKLLEKIDKGDVSAIRTYFELKSKLKSHQTKIDNRNIRYKVTFGKRDSEGTDDRLRSAPEPAEGDGGQE